MCNIWQKYRDDPNKYKKELTIEEIRELFITSNFLKRIRHLLIGGGEPFLKKDFVEIILFFYEINSSLVISIASNGQRPDLIDKDLTAISNNLMKMGINENRLNIGFSIDGIGESHDRIRGINGSYQRVLESVERVKKIKGLNTAIAFTFTPENYREFPAVYDLSKQLDILLRFQFAQTSNHYYGNVENQFYWTVEQLAEIRDILFHTGHLNSKSNGSLTNCLMNPTPFFLEYVLTYQQNSKRSFNCFSGTHSCYMDPYGNIFPCIILDKSFGNIRKQNFDSLWKSTAASQIRDSISQRECHCCSSCDIPISIQKNWKIIPWNLKKIVFPDKFFHA